MSGSTMANTEHYALDPGARVLLTDLGLSVDAILRRAGLPGDLLSRGPAALSAEQYFSLWRAMEAEADDPLLPIRIGRAVTFESFAPPVFAAMCSPNLGVAATRIARHKALMGPLRLIVTPQERGLELELRWPAHHQPPEVLTTTELVWWVALVRLATRRPVTPVAVTSFHGPSAGDALTDYLGVRVQRGERCTVTFSDRDAALPFVTSNEQMWEYFEPELRKRLAQLEADATTRQRVRAVLLELLPSGRGTLDAVASQLATSPRTLQRQLRNEGTSFQPVLRETRASLAEHYLREGRLEVTEIAFLLGYDEPNSFYRAFQSWTGRTPNAARQPTTP